MGVSDPRLPRLKDLGVTCPPSPDIWTAKRGLMRDPGCDVRGLDEDKLDRQHPLLGQVAIGLVAIGLGEDCAFLYFGTLLFHTPAHTTGA